MLKGSAIAAEVTRKDNVVESTRRQFELRKQLHERLNNEGAIVIDDKGIATLTRDVPFSSPSAAAAFVQGRATANGRREWRTKENDYICRLGGAEVICFKLFVPTPVCKVAVEPLGSVQSVGWFSGYR